MEERSMTNALYLWLKCPSKLRSDCIVDRNDAEQEAFVKRARGFLDRNGRLHHPPTSELGALEAAGAEELRYAREGCIDGCAGCAVAGGLCLAPQRFRGHCFPAVDRTLGQSSAINRAISSKDQRA